MAAEFKFTRECNIHPELNGKRYVSTGKCPACEKIRGRVYKENNLEKVKTARKLYEVRNSEKLKNLDKRWAKLNPERKSFHSLKWAKKNPDKKNAAVAKRKACQLLATPSWANTDYINGIYEVCLLFRKMGIDMHVDHIVPLHSKIVCGLHCEDNLQLLTRADNCSKGNRSWPDM